MLRVADVIARAHQLCCLSQDSPPGLPSISFPIIRVPAGTRGVNSAKAPPFSCSLPPASPASSLLLSPLPSSAPRLPRPAGRSRRDPSSGPFPCRDPGGGAGAPRTPGIPEIRLPAPTPAHAPAPEIRGCQPPAPPPLLRIGVRSPAPCPPLGTPPLGPFSLPPTLASRSLPQPPLLPSHPSPHPGPPAKVGCGGGRGESPLRGGRKLR